MGDGLRRAARILDAVGTQQRTFLQTFRTQQRTDLVGFATQPHHQHAGKIRMARVAAQRGHKVTLYDKANSLGGLLPMAAIVKDLETEDITQFVNQRMKVMIIEVNPEERNLLVSRRALLAATV